MSHNEIEGNVIGEVWRAQETAKEITYFTIQGQNNWFRIVKQRPIFSTFSTF